MFCLCINLIVLLVLLIVNTSSSYQYQCKHHHHHHRVQHQHHHHHQSSFQLLAGFGNKISSSSSSSSNSIVDDCPCLSGLKYKECCGSLHDKTSTTTSPSKVIMARYTAYKLDNPNYIIESTSPTCTDYEFYVLTAQGNGMNAWVRAIRRDMIDTYVYVKQEIVSESIEADGRKATVLSRLLAIGKIDNVMYPVEDESTMVYLNDQWYFEKSDVRRPPPDVAAAMMDKWPQETGITLRVVADEQLSSAADPENPLDKVPLNKMTRGGMRTYGGGIGQSKRR